MFKMPNKYSGLLGINSRNLQYIKPYNKREAVKLADSKLKTKHFLSARGIPVPRLYNVIRNHEELTNFDFGSLPGDVVLKPNRGLGGEGIMVFKSRKGKNFITVGGRKISTQDMKSHITDILDGRFSINNTPDFAFFEQRIINNPELDKYSYKGLPDIRIIVYNLVPVMAMLRLPTRESLGKANLAQGALGVGIDLATGKPTHIALKNKIIKEIPGVGKFDKDFKIPFFDEMLLIASRCQIITNLGYLACDIALDETNGPILLEVNARAGLKVQLANKAPLKARLEKIADVKVTTPEKGVRVAKDLFSKKENIISTNNKEINTIGLEEIVEIILPNEKLTLKARIDPKEEISIINRSHQDKLPALGKNQSKIKINISGKRTQTIVKFKKLTGEHDFILGKRDLKGFLIDINKKIQSEISESKLPKEQKTESPKQYYYTPRIDLGQVDFEIKNVSKQIKLIKRITPINLIDELEKFDKNKEYNPLFQYETNEELVLELLKNLENIKSDSSNLGQIFEGKRKELITQVRLMEHIGTSEYKEFAKKLYPLPKKAELEDAKKYLKNEKRYKDNLGKKLNAKQAGKYFEEQLKKYKLKDWKVEFKSRMVGDCSVNKSNRIFINSNAKFTEWRLKKLVAHEIETHIITAENGKKQPYAIFQNGTANYLETQEGLAIYNQELALKVYPKNYFAAHSFIANDIINKHSFAESYHKLIEELGIKPQRAKSLCLKVKRGIHDTSEKGCIAKQAIYFRGAKKIEKFVKDGNDLKRLYIGKISIDDLKKIEAIESINSPVLLPDWY